MLRQQFQPEIEQAESVSHRQSLLDLFPVTIFYFMRFFASVTFMKYISCQVDFLPKCCFLPKFGLKHVFHPRQVLLSMVLCEVNCSVLQVLRKQLYIWDIAELTNKNNMALWCQLQPASTGKPKSVIVAWSDASERLGSVCCFILLVSPGFVGI